MMSVGKILGLVALVGFASLTVELLIHYLFALLPLFCVFKFACVAIAALLFLTPGANTFLAASFISCEGVAGALAAVAPFLHPGVYSGLSMMQMICLGAFSLLPAAALGLGITCAVGGILYLVREHTRNLSDAVCDALHRTRDVSGKQVFITGGATGLGKALAGEFLSRGAYVTIVSRNDKHLSDASEELIKNCNVPKDRIRYIVCDVTKPESVKNALDGWVPDIVVTSAGLSHPGRFLTLCEGSADAFRSEMELNFFGTLNVVRAVVPGMAQRGSGSLVLVSSALGLVGCPGYSTYTPSKYAVRGLADTLRLELAPHGIDVHIVFPSNMITPSYAEEMKTKPPEASKIDERAHNEMPETSAKWVFARYLAGDYAICNNNDLDALYMTAASANPSSSPLIDFLMTPVVWIAIAFERMTWESCTAEVYKAEHAKKE